MDVNSFTLIFKESIEMTYATVAVSVFSLVVLGFLCGYSVGVSVASKSGAVQPKRDSKGRFTK